MEESTDESFLRWRVSLEEGEENTSMDSEESASEPLLKTMVRTSYLYHLRQSLRKNLEASKQKENYAVEDAIVNKVVKGCSALLEEKALRQCMIARLYQRVMIQMIKEVKKATSECNLYTPLQEFAERQTKPPVMNAALHKETQTELSNIFFTSQIADLFSQTEALLQKMNPLSQNLEIPLEQNVNGLSPSRGKRTKPINGISRPESQCFNDYSDPIHANFNGKEEKPAVNKRKMCDNRINFSDDEIAHKSTHIKPDSPIPFQPAEDTRTTKTNSKSNTFEVRLRSPTFAESVALWYNLECEIEELPPTKKQKLEEKFVQLFGIDHAVDYYCLTNEQKSIACRKRIAKFVVIELTNFYVQKRIATKQLFKTLAKHITSVLLGRSLYPSPEEINRSVGEFFLNDRIINSEDDFYF
ncbi:uncharacterized protein LOC135847074 [Planococcus citri]|uniref:uncharacterized protein LOC135847074 n=1 Tax=Planococcus citri TaxID=170843 RepID=UPI0031F83DC9